MPDPSKTDALAAKNADDLATAADDLSRFADDPAEASAGDAGDPQTIRRRSPSPASSHCEQKAFASDDDADDVSKPFSDTCAHCGQPGGRDCAYGEIEVRLHEQCEHAWIDAYDGRSSHETCQCTTCKGSTGDPQATCTNQMGLPLGDDRGAHLRGAARQ
jgi:hypothetical protein